MFRAGRLQTAVAGFWRGTAIPPTEIEGARAILLGRSFDARLLHRALISVRKALFPSSLVGEIAMADVVVARNLEMLAIAASASRNGAKATPLVYEVLDIHRVLLGNGVKARALRAIERRLMQRVSLLLVSSPAFLREYFEPFQFRQSRPMVHAIENKALSVGEGDGGCPPSPTLPPGPPWRVGWLGVIRCRRSLEILGRLASRRPDLLRVRIFGRLTREVAKDLGKMLPTATLEYGGAYTPAELPRLYGQVHFNWAIDFYEENANSQWLLPNRVYEGGRFNAVPMAVNGTETARWLEGLKLGVMFDDPRAQLEDFLDSLTEDSYRQLKRACVSAPRSRFIAGRGDCDRLAGVLTQIVEVPPTGHRAPVPCNVA